MNKKIIQISCVAMMVVLVAMTGSAATGDFTNLYAFVGGSTAGQWPMATPTLVGGQFWGMTQIGGVSNFGTIYRIATGGTGYTNLVSFNGANGAYPIGKLLLNGGYLYGMTPRGGTYNNGVIFRIATNGTGYTVLYHFNQTNVNSSAMPWGGLALSGTNLYGLTYFGGVANLGVAFRINLDGSGYTNLHHFTGFAGDGSHPKGDVLIDGGKLYGMTAVGGAKGAGVIFRMNVNGTSYQNLYEFQGGSVDGELPSGNLIKDGNYLYGMAHGGASKGGIIFNIHTNGGTLNILKILGGNAQLACEPFGSLTKQGDRFYGMTRYGGTNWSGVIFSIGGAYSNHYMWPKSVGEPLSDPVFIGNALYGSTLKGGNTNRGTLFKYEPLTNDPSAAWSAVTWIENRPLTTVTEGDWCSDRHWVQHGKSAGFPDFAYVGYGDTQNFDDSSWHWVPMTAWGDVGTDWEFTGTIGRASGGNHFTAIKFIKGSHVYYAATIGSWGDWNTALYTTNRWTVIPLVKPSNCTATAVSSNQINLGWQGDGTHWVTVFRSTSPTMPEAVDGTDYTTGWDYDQGKCVYHGSAASFSDTGLTPGLTYYYKFFTDNYGYYSTSSTANATTPGGGGGKSYIPMGLVQNTSKASKILATMKSLIGIAEPVVYLADDFADGDADGWRAAPLPEVEWQVNADYSLESVVVTEGSYSYCTKDSLDITDKPVSIAFDIKFDDGALYGGFVYRGRVLYVNPTACGWADEKALYYLDNTGVTIGQWHHVVVDIHPGKSGVMSDLYVDGKAVFEDELVDGAEWSSSTIGFLSSYGIGSVEWDNVRVVED